MKVRVAFTVEVNEDFRRALRRRYGQTGMASRKEVHDWYRDNADSIDSDLMDEYWKSEPNQ